MKLKHIQRANRAKSTSNVIRNTTLRRRLRPPLFRWSKKKTLPI